MSAVVPSSELSPGTAGRLSPEKNLICPLCAAAGRLFYADPRTERAYGVCPRCSLHYMSPTDRLSLSQEATHYRLHNNDVTDLRYQAFVRPLYDEVRRHFPPGAVGLDFGAGPGPALAEMLRRDGYDVSLYDPIYWPNAAALAVGRYDFIVASEVVEHFYHPRDEFIRLRTLLKEGGMLAVMTLFLAPEITFADWHYRRDPTHVVFYSPESLMWIKDQVGFSELTTDGSRVAVFRR